MYDGLVKQLRSAESNYQETLDCLWEAADAIENLSDGYNKAKRNERNWKNAFQRWSNKMAWDENNHDSYGKCGYGSMCDYCEDNGFGRPCVRALNAMLREENKVIDYSRRDFEKIWKGV